MLDLVEELGRQVVINSVPGEHLETKSPVGVKMIMSRWIESEKKDKNLYAVLYYLFRLPYSKTIGEDTDGDLYPDIPLTFRFEDSVGVVQFPLGFCPGDR